MVRRLDSPTSIASSPRHWSVLILANGDHSRRGRPMAGRRRRREPRGRSIVPSSRPILSFCLVPPPPTPPRHWSVLILANGDHSRRGRPMAGRRRRREPRGRSIVPSSRPILSFCLVPARPPVSRNKLELETDAGGHFHRIEGDHV